MKKIWLSLIILTISFCKINSFSEIILKNNTEHPLTVQLYSKFNNAWGEKKVIPAYGQFNFFTPLAYSTISVKYKGSPNISSTYIDINEISKSHPNEQNNIASISIEPATAYGVKMGLIKIIKNNRLEDIEKEKMKKEEQLKNLKEKLSKKIKH